MAYFIQLEDASGSKRDSINDLTGDFYSLILRTQTVKHECPRLLDFINPYGDTVFNELQMGQLEIEVNELASYTETEKEVELLSKTRSLIQRCKRGGLYLKFYGD